jgi:hypothetical protein
MTIHSFELADDATLDLKDELMDIIDKKSTVQGIMALTCALTEVIAQTAPSKKSAIEGIAAVTATLTASINAYDLEGLCRWNETYQ